SAHVANGCVEIERAQAAERVLEPLAVALEPVERRTPTVRMRGVPAFRQPKFRALVAFVPHEREELAVRRRPRRELEALEENAVTRALVVEREPLARMADLGRARLVPVPAQRGRASSRDLRRLSIDGMQRILRQQMLHVGQQELLMLLLVVQAELDEPR